MKTNKKATHAHIKVIPGAGFLGKNTQSVPRQYRRQMAEHNAKQITNQFLNNHNANIAQSKPKGDCGCGD